MSCRRTSFQEQNQLHLSVPTWSAYICPPRPSLKGPCSRILGQFQWLLTLHVSKGMWTERGQPTNPKSSPRLLPLAQPEVNAQWMFAKFTFLLSGLISGRSQELVPLRWLLCPQASLSHVLKASQQPPLPLGVTSRFSSLLMGIIAGCYGYPDSCLDGTIS